jgi:hypothetical protein
MVRKRMKESELNGVEDKKLGQNKAVSQSGSQSGRKAVSQSVRQAGRRAGRKAVSQSGRQAVRQSGSQVRMHAGSNSTVLDESPLPSEEGFMQLGSECLLHCLFCTLRWV